MTALTRGIVLLLTSACLLIGYGLPTLAGEIADRFNAAGRQASTRPSPTSRPTTASGTGITQIGLERATGFGRGPAYAVIIQADGTFRYTGTVNTSRRGVHTGKVKPGDLVQVLRYIDDSGFEHLGYTYYAPSRSDQPRTYIAVTTASGEKIICTAPFSAPVKIWAIEQLIDKLLLEAQWDAPAGAERPITTRPAR
jgi:hypothetical protein